MLSPVVVLECGVENYTPSCEHPQKISLAYRYSELSPQRFTLLHLIPSSIARSPTTSRKHVGTLGVTQPIDLAKPGHSENYEGPVNIFSQHDTSAASILIPRDEDSRDGPHVTRSHAVEPQYEDGYARLCCR
jgi:hypothetical protein